MKEYIKKPNGYILGTIETDYNGDRIARDFSGRILGYYRKNRGVTTDFAGVIIAIGDVTAALIFNK